MKPTRSYEITIGHIPWSCESRGRRRKNDAGTRLSSSPSWHPYWHFPSSACIEVARALMAAQCLEEAARSGCRIAVLRGATSSDVDAEVQRILTPAGITTYAIQIQPTNMANAVRWTPVEVTVTAALTT